MDRKKLNCIIEYIKSCGQFSYEIEEVIGDLSKILADYGVYTALNDDEYLTVTDELLELAEESEIMESVRFASKVLVCGSDSLSDYRIPDILRF